MMKNKFKLIDLPYEYDALEPHIDKETVRIHHDLHHKAYLDNLNKALQDHPEFESWSLEDMLSKIEKLPEPLKTNVKKHGGGVYNHNLYFDLMKKETKPSGKLLEAINIEFGSFETFELEFKKVAMGVFGSGWAWLVKNATGTLEIVQTANQETPLKHGLRPIINVDVWEHSYYLKYQNKRKDYLDEWFKVINWDKALENYLT